MYKYCLRVYRMFHEHLIFNKRYFGGNCRVCLGIIDIHFYLTTTGQLKKKKNVDYKTILSIYSREKSLCQKGKTFSLRKISYIQFILSFIIHFLQQK